MKKIALMGLLILALSSIASANSDVAWTEKAGSGVKLGINGGVGGAASDVFDILEKGGATQEQLMEGKALKSQFVQASKFYLNGARITAEFSLLQKPTTQNLKKVEGGFTGTLQFSGPAAAELANMMERAGLNVTPQGIAGAETLRTADELVKCTKIVRPGAPVTCEIVVK